MMMKTQNTNHKLGNFLSTLQEKKNNFIRYFSMKKSRRKKFFMDIRNGEKFKDFYAESDIYVFLFFCNGMNVISLSIISSSTKHLLLLYHFIFCIS